jgi:hypothetical protein
MMTGDHNQTPGGALSQAAKQAQQAIDAAKEMAADADLEQRITSCYRRRGTGSAIPFAGTHWPPLASHSRQVSCSRSSAADRRPETKTPAIAGRSGRRAEKGCHL